MSDWTPDRIQQLLDRLGQTPPQLAETCGVSRASVYHWLKGLHPPQAATAKLLELLEQGRVRGVKIKRS